MKFFNTDRLESCSKLLVRHFLNSEIRLYRFIHCLSGINVLGKCSWNVTICILIIDCNRSVLLYFFAFDRDKVMTGSRSLVITMRMSLTLHAITW